MISTSWSMLFSPAKIGCPISNSAKTQPTDHISDDEHKNTITHKQSMREYKPTRCCINGTQFNEYESEGKKLQSLRTNTLSVVNCSKYQFGCTIITRTNVKYIGFSLDKRNNKFNQKWMNCEMRLKCADSKSKERESTLTRILALPKSQSFKTWVSGSMRRFWGLMSRWQIPREWM